MLKRTTNVKIGAPNIVINAPVGSIRDMKKAGEISRSVLFKILRKVLLIADRINLSTLGQANETCLYWLHKFF